MRLLVRGVLTASALAAQRVVQCRLTGHAWTDMAYPPACAHCGRTQLVSGGARPAAEPGPGRLAA